MNDNHNNYLPLRRGDAGPPQAKGSAIGTTGRLLARRVARQGRKGKGTVHRRQKSDYCLATNRFAGGRSFHNQ
jgi:hypothetical protein